MAASKSSCQAVQGQSRGRWRVSLRAGGDPAGNVDQVGAHGGPPCSGVAGLARTPVARARLNAITAWISHAEFAVLLPDGKWAMGPSLSSAMTCSMTAWSRWRASASTVWKVS